MGEGGGGMASKGCGWKGSGGRKRREEEEGGEVWKRGTDGSGSWG